ncbi:MAG: HDIG domain-containing metalloprotein [Halobacteriota archaeon]
MPSNNLPSEAEALQLLKNSGCSEKLIKHVKAVSQYSEEVAKLRGDADVALVRIGGLLHDIGRCKTNSIRHGIAGGKLLHSYGVDDRVAQIAEKHIGAGITAEEAERLSLPPGDYMPRTVEQKIVAAVDNLVEGSRRISIEKAEADFYDKVDRQTALRVRSLHDDVFNYYDRFQNDA